MKMVLFVCTGNICRSPMAEALFLHRIGDGMQWEACSAGIYTGAGTPASTNAVEAMRELGIDLARHRSQPLTTELVQQADLIVTMTSGHRFEILQDFPEVGNRVFLIKSFGTSKVPADITDPFGGSLNVYRKIRDEIDRALSDLILFIRTEKHKKRDEFMKIAIGSDHGGYALKTRLIDLLGKKGITVEDMGCDSTDAVDYPDYAAAVAEAVSNTAVDQGIIICTTGIGVSITANKFPRVRAALCLNAEMAAMTRQHNNANVLCLSGKFTPQAETEAIVDAWLNAAFEGGRHERRVKKIKDYASETAGTIAVYDTDPEIYAVLKKEDQRQKDNLELIASENIVSKAVREAQGSRMTNKYAEGYPAKRWYNGCEWVDEAERLAIDRAKELFGAEHANVQPHCGSSANMGVYFAVLNPGDTILAMSLAEGGHLTHGHPMNFSGRFFNIVPYGVDQEDEQIDYDQLQKLANEHKPKMIVAGASAYSRIIDFKKLHKIAASVGAYLTVDMAHIAGLVATGCHPSPVPHADFVTTTTHKTLRGPRGGMILCKEKFAADIDKQIFPGIQGGPLMHTIAAKAVCFHEALQPEFKQYQQQVVKNAQALAAALEDDAIRMVSGGTDNHLMLVDLTKTGVTGKDAAAVLDKAAITVNKNGIPFDKKSPFVTSGIRIGTPAVTTRGMKEAEMEKIASFIKRVLRNAEDETVIAQVREEVLALTATFPIP